MTTNALAIIARQTGAIVLPDSKGWRNRLQIRSESSDRLYTVAQRSGSGEWACSCMGWIRHRHCKHLSTMMPALRTIGAAHTKMAAD